MSFRVVPHPLARAVPLPAVREGGLDPSLLAACVPVPGHASLIDRLRERGVLAVTTGQQPALFTGPMYTMHKALSAAALARELEQRWQRPVVPLFWVAGDDHDFAEANHAAWLGADGGVRRAVLRQRPAGAPMLPLYREPLGSEVTGALNDFEATVPESEFRAETVAWLTRHYQPGATVAGSFAAALAELLAPFGVVCIDSTHAAFKRAAAPHLIRALAGAQPIEAALVARSAALSAAGADPGVAVGDGATLVMLEASAGRDRLVRDGTGFITRRGRERYSLADVDHIAATEPERLSANVLLRPVVESALLPTVAYAAGPGELRYLELTAPVYEQLGVVRQLPVPRWSGTIIEARVDRVLEKFGITLDELAGPLPALEARLVRERLPTDAETDLSALRDVLSSRYAELRHTAERVDPTLARSVEGRRDRALADVYRIERKLITQLKRRLSVELRQLGSARDAVQPDGSPQERVLCAPSFLARHGPRVLEAAAECAYTWYAGALETSPVSV